MDCRQAQDEILELLDERRSVDIPARVARRTWQAVRPVRRSWPRQTALDARFGEILTPPEFSASFRSTLKHRIRRESPGLWPDALPDIVHFASCAAATVLCAVLLPFAAGAVLAAGATATAITYLLITAARIWFEA